MYPKSYIRNKNNRKKKFIELCQFFANVTIYIMLRDYKDNILNKTT